MKNKAILIDDEPLALKRLEKLLKAFETDLEIVGIATNGTDAIKLIDRLKPDVIFLDIQMPELNGFEVLERIRHQPFVIFSTAYDEFALKAFETNSIDYLLKPVDTKRLKRAIDKLNTFRGQDLEEFQHRLQNLLGKIDSPSTRIRVKMGDSIKLLPADDIFFFVADEKYTRVNTYDKAYLIDSSLNALEEQLDPNFVRVHRSVLVNLNHMDEIFKMFKGNYQVRMKDANRTDLPVSRQLKYKLGL